MIKHTTKKEKDFVQIPNSIFASNGISLKAKGLLSLMLSLPDSWNFSIEGIASRCKESKQSIAAAVKELEEAGYIKRSMVRDDKGRIQKMEYEIFEKPVTLTETEVHYDQEQNFDEIVELMTEIICSNRKEITISGNAYQTEYVKRKFLSINREHMEYIISCISKNTTKIGNIKQYLISTIFNASNTVDSYYTTLVKHNMYG